MFMLKKGQAQLLPIIISVVMSIIISGIVIYLIFFPTMRNINSVTARSVVNETINFAANNTYYSFINQANCLDAGTYPENCGVKSVSYVGNNSVTLLSGNYTFTSEQIKLMRDPAGIGVGNYNVSYTWYDFNIMPTGQIQNFNVVLILGGVMVILVALVGFMMLIRLIG